jgi:hypothetical protein
MPVREATVVYRIVRGADRSAPAGAGQAVHSRLTHSLKVAQGESNIVNVAATAQSYTSIPHPHKLLCGVAAPNDSDQSLL